MRYKDLFLRILVIGSDHTDKVMDHILNKFKKVKLEKLARNVTESNDPSKILI